MLAINEKKIVDIRRISRFLTILLFLESMSFHELLQDFIEINWKEYMVFEYEHDRSFIEPGILKKNII